MGDLLGGVRLVVRSNAGGFELSPFDGQSSGIGGWISKLIQPDVQVVSGDAQLYEVAPAGQPSEFPWLLYTGLAGVVAAGLALFLLGRLSK